MRAEFIEALVSEMSRINNFFVNYMGALLMRMSVIKASDHGSHLTQLLEGLSEDIAQMRRFVVLNYLVQ